WLEQAVRQLEREGLKQEPLKAGAPHVPAMKQLMDLVGLALSDKQVALALASTEVEREKDGKTITLMGTGFDITSGSGVIEQIELYFSPSTGRTFYGGSLIGGLKNDDPRIKVREKIGMPIACDKNSAAQLDPTMGWDAYHINGARVQFSFRPDHSGISWI